MIKNKSSKKYGQLWRMRSNVFKTIVASTIILGVFFSYAAGEFCKSKLRLYLISQAKTIAATIPDQLVVSLTGTEKDLENPSYQELKKKMVYIRQVNPGVRFIYIMGYRNEQLFFYADSELSDSPDYSPPGDVYSEATQEKVNGYLERRSFVEGPYQDRWGTWVSGYAPLISSIDPKTTVGMVGVDIGDKYWQEQVWIYRIIPLLIAGIILVIIVWFYFFNKKSHDFLEELEEAYIKLSESEKKFKHVSENMPGMIYQLLYRPDGTMNFLYVSDACAKIYGLSREEIMQDALTVRRAVDQQDLSSFEETIQEATKRLSTWIWEGRIYNAQTKSTRWLRGVSQPERLPGGETVWNGIMIDITDQKESEIKLKQNEERLKFALEASNDGLFDMNVVKAIMYYSPRFIEMLGYTGNESDLKYTSGEFIDFIHPDDQDRIMPDLQEAILSAQPWNAEYRLRTRSGEYVWFNVRGRTQLNEFDKPLRFAGFITDITERKQVEQAKTEFVSIASHQLRTPLTAINWYIEMLLDGSIGKCSKEQKEYLQQIYSSNRRMVDLVNSLLNVSRIDMGTFAIDPEPTDFVEISKSVVMELQPQIVTKHLIVNEEYRGSIPIINADPKLVRIIFQNLVSNAVKYTPEKGNVIIKIEVGKPIVGGKKIAKDMLMITVSDTGYGIPKNQQSHIFSKLFRADNAREKVAEGTGLGLYIVKSIIEAANGKIWFESEENKGTTFYAILPLGGMSKKAGTKGLS